MPTAACMWVPFGAMAPPPFSPRPDSSAHPYTSLLLWAMAELRMKGAAARSFSCPSPPSSQSPSWSPTQRKWAAGPCHCQPAGLGSPLLACLAEFPPGVPWDCLVFFSNCLCRVGEGRKPDKLSVLARELGQVGGALPLATLRSTGLRGPCSWSRVRRSPLCLRPQRVCCSKKSGLCWASGDLGCVTGGPGSGHLSLGFLLHKEGAGPGDLVGPFLGPLPLRV